MLYVICVYSVEVSMEATPVMLTIDPGGYYEDVSGFLWEPVSFVFKANVSLESVHAPFFTLVLAGALLGDEPLLYERPQ